MLTFSAYKLANATYSNGNPVNPSDFFILPDGRTLRERNDERRAARAKIGEMRARIKKSTNLTAREKREQLSQNTYAAVNGAPNWAERYPLFSLEVTAEDYIWKNRTGYRESKEHTDKQPEFLRGYSARNVAEGGAAVKRALITTCSNGDNLSVDTHTNGWVPVQSGILTENDKITYLIEFGDGTTTGWRLWGRSPDAAEAIQVAGVLLYGLVAFPAYRRDVRMNIVTKNGKEH